MTKGIGLLALPDINHTCFILVDKTEAPHFLHPNLRIVNKHNIFKLHGNLTNQYRFIPNHIRRFILESNYDVYDSCMPIYARQVSENPQTGSELVFQNLKNTYLGSPLTSIIRDSASMHYIDRWAPCHKCGTYLKPTRGKLNAILAANNICPQCAEKYQEDIQAPPSKGFLVKPIASTKYEILSTPDQLQMLKEKPYGQGISQYYPTIDLSQLTPDQLQLPLIERQFTILGLGSAGSGLIDQLVRTNLVQDMTLVDFDTIEAKNLRNQIYTQGSIGSAKTTGTQKIIQTIAPTIKTHLQNALFKPEKFKRIKSRYLMTGFDNLESRKVVLNAIKDGTTKTDYLIDTRYDGLNASVFLVNTSNEDQLAYYESILDEAISSIPDTKSLYTTNDTDKDQIINACEWLVKNIAIPGGCFNIQDICKRSPAYTEVTENTSRKWRPCERGECPSSNCSGQACVKLLAPQILRCLLDNEQLIKLINDKLQTSLTVEGVNSLLPEIIEHQTKQEQEVAAVTCTDWNIIHIYKYASSFLTSAIIALEDDNNPRQLFTHIECTVDPLPNSMILKR